jgi:hypothetical protein
VRVTLLVCVLLPSGACTGPAARTGGLELSASADPYEADIPLPAGFALVDRSSEDWSSGPLRYLRHTYVGRADKYTVRKFYREQMPLVRWTALADRQLHGRYTLRFRRGREMCTIVIAGQGSRLYPRTTVDVTIYPGSHESNSTSRT